MQRHARAPRETSFHAREQLCGAALAIYLVIGRWSPARLIELEPSLLLEPRTWTVLVLIVLALTPARPEVGLRADRAGVAALPSWWTASLLAQLGFWSWTTLAATWSPAPDEALALELFDIALIVATMLALHRLVLVLDPRATLDALRRYLLLALVLLAGLGLLGGLGEGRAAALGGGPNVFGRNMGLLCVLSLERAVLASAGQRSPGSVVLAVLAAALVALSGSRGAMAATVLASAALLLFGRARLGRRVLVLGLGLIAGMLVLGFTELGARIVAAISERVVDLLLGQGYVSNRDQIYVIALEMGLERPLLGHGLGSFAVETPWPYAHDIVLDAWAETGLVGVALLGACMGVWALALINHRKPFGPDGPMKPAIDGLAATGLLLLVASLFSGGRFDARGLFCLATLTTLVPLLLPNEERAR